MNPELPPPIHTSATAPVLPGLKLAEPAMWFPLGPPSEEAQRLARTILEYRPGALILFDTR
jgi:hypothetical protein